MNIDFMPRNRALVPFPSEVSAEIDQIVSHEKCTSFLVNLAKQEIKRQRLLKIFDYPEPIWRPEDHPEIDDAGEWVRKLRAETEARFQRIQASQQTTERDE